MKCSVFYLILCVLATHCVCSSWSSNVNSVFSSKTISSAMSSGMAEELTDGIKTAMEFCSKEFKWKPWNCPQSAFSRRNNNLLTKEIAFTRAIISAAIVHRLSRRCSKGDNNNSCLCNSVQPSAALQKVMEKMEAVPPSKRQKLPSGSMAMSLQNLQKELKKIDEESNKNESVVWSWGGCSDDPGYGEEKSKKIFADYEKGNDAHAFIERHNNRVGRQVVRDTMIRKCRCHGVSGSCSHQTCWMQVGSFGTISRSLKQRYKNAIRLSFEQIRGARTIGNTARLQFNQKWAKITTKQLVYLDESPDYCIPNESIGWPGTKGRTCSRPSANSTDHEEKRSCRNLCRACGHRVKKQKKMISTRCNCTFQWCCEVKCEMCVETVEQHFCS